ncbi:MAG: SRPBCC family protein [Proteobacteria bacterium]|nr:SRPBCC family protein [Pseudomonadota bacterium]
MKVINIHERELPATSESVGNLIDSLASRADVLWPWHSWPRMEFDQPLGVGAVGGHGPIRYFVEEYLPGRSITFRFTGPKGFDGFHGFSIVNISEKSVLLRHTLQMITHGPAILSWPLIFRPLHDALLEDSLAYAQASLGQTPQMHAWSSWVKLLRWLVSGGKTRPQVTPKTLSGHHPRSFVTAGNTRDSVSHHQGGAAGQENE